MHCRTRMLYLAASIKSGKFSRDPFYHVFRKSDLAVIKFTKSVSNKMLECIQNA